MITIKTFQGVKTLSTFTQIKRTYAALMSCYVGQTIDKETVLKCLQNKDFQSKYVNY